MPAVNIAVIAAESAAHLVSASASASPTAPTGSSTFADSLSSALQSVSESQGRAADLSASYERGDTIDIAKVMLARQQASVSFEATLQVRNKLLSAYKDIMSMPV